MKRTLIIILCLCSLVFAQDRPYRILNSFNAGELSELLSAREDLSKYHSGCSIMENFFPLPQGGAQKRPGTVYVATAKDDDYACRLVSFEYSTVQTYILEFGSQYIRFYKNNVQIMDGGDPYEISTPYATDDLFSLQYTQSADVLYITGANYAPRKLSRTGHTSWTLTKIDFKGGPFLDLNTEKMEGASAVVAKNLADNGTASETGSTLGTSSGAISNTNDEDYDTYWQREQYDSGIDFEFGYTVTAKFTIEIAFANTISVLDKVKYWIGWLNNSYRAAGFSYNRIISCEVKYGGSWYVIGTSTSTSVEISGPWYDVTHVKIYMYTQSRADFGAQEGWIRAKAKLFELEAWTPDAPIGGATIYVISTNTDTYDRTLDNAAIVDQGGTPNVVRIASTAHGFLANDYVIIMGTTNYDGTHKVTNINAVDTFDIEYAYIAETPAGTESVSSRVVLTATDESDIFNANHVDSLFKMVHPIDTIEYSETLTDNYTNSQVENTSWMDCGTIYKGSTWYLTTIGTWTGVLEIQRNYTVGAAHGVVGWKPVLAYAAADDRNVITTSTENVATASYRAILTESGDASETCKVYFRTNQTEVLGIARITQYVDPCNVRAVIIDTLSTITSTENWAEGAWSDDEGWPRTVTFFEDRLVFGGNNGQPDTIWASMTSDYENMTAGADDDDALVFTLSSRGVNIIKWLVSRDKILIGTSGAEWTLEGSADEPLTPSNVKAERHSTYGSADLQAILAGENTLFFQRGAEKMRELAYNWESDSYIAPDMTILIPEITGNGITNMAFQQIPDSILWCIKENGDIAVFTYERKELLTSWSRLLTDGDFESVAVISGTDEDQVWVSVKRTIESNDVRYIEYFSSRDFGTDVDDAFYVDSGITYDSTATTTITGLDHLDGEIVGVLGDGAIQTNVLVAGGQITITEASTVQVGLLYTAQLRTMPLSWVAQGMTIQGRIKRINEVITRYYNSGNFSIGRSASIKQTVAIDGMETDEQRITFPPGYDRPGYVFIYQQSVEPLTLLALMVEFQIY